MVLDIRFLKKTGIQLYLLKKSFLWYFRKPFEYNLMIIANKNKFTGQNLQLYT